jgi:DNA-directed RNA polymerase subunit M/transcription elongation factor TFIIS
MEFCDICDNLLYLRSEEDHALVKYCKHCAFSERESAEGRPAMKVSENLYSEDEPYLQYQNKYLRCDPTLPRVSDTGLQCPNTACSGPPENPQVLYVKYHPVHMKYLYCCDYCGTTWKKE